MTLIVRRAGVCAANGHWLLRGIDHACAQGAVTLVLGPVGAGKSTLLELLGGVRQADAGTVELDGAPVGSSLQTGRRIAMVFQQSEEQLFARSVRGELAYSLRPYRLPGGERERRAQEALRSVGGEVAWLDRSPFSLSGGQRRRAALAAALATPADWRLFDEPTAGLDRAGATRFAMRLRELAQTSHGGVIVATHDLETCLPWADHVWLLREGRMVGVLSAAELREHPEWFAEAGLPVPAPIRLKRRLADIGVRMPSAWPTPEDVAAAIVAKAAHAADSRVMRQGTAMDGADTAGAAAPTSAAAHAATPDAGAAAPEAATVPEAATSRAAPADDRTLASKATPHPSTPYMRRNDRDLDPRAAWILFAALSVGALLESAWPGIALTSALVAAIAWQRQARTLWRSLRPFMLLMLLAAALSGIAKGSMPPFGWTWRLAPALQTLQHMAPVANALALAALLAETVAPGRLQQGLQRLLAHGERIVGWRAGLTLAASLTLRFIRLIGLEWERFSRIVRTRGKRRAKPGRLPVRDAPALLVPLLLSLLRDADALATSLEDRGLQTAGQPRTNASPMRLTQADRRALFLGALAAAALVAASFWR